LDLGRSAAAGAGAAVEFVRLDDHGLGDLGTDFDLVFSVYALQFVPDVARVMQLLAERLRSGGRLLISVDHPMRLSGEWRDDEFLVEDYFAQGWQSWPYDFPEAGITVEMRRYRRPIQDWVNALLSGPRWKFVWGVRAWWGFARVRGVRSEPVGRRGRLW
jgi:SAM-dependent methyltransferase